MKACSCAIAAPIIGWWANNSKRLYTAAQREDVYELLAHHYSLSDDHAQSPART